VALLDNFKIGTVGTGVVIGIGALLLAPAIIPAVGTVVRPIAKAVIKSGLIVFEKTRELIAEAQETVADMAAEAQAELAIERRQAPPAAPDAGEE
jgi:hypothetical protein